MTLIGKLERVELRELWKHEEYDFSAWLAKEDNLKMLGETVGIDLLLEDTEVPVGKFSVDILATEDGTNNKVIIENQLEETNHDHLGKIITYAAGQDAKYVIWIVKHAREEHRNAIKWLNENTIDDINFFLLEIELWRIGDSLPAPKFNLVEKTKDWQGTEKSTSAEVSERGKMLNEFWSKWVEFAQNDSTFKHQFKLRKPSPHHWFNLAIGMTGAHIDLTALISQNMVTAGIYINDDKEYYENLGDHAEEIEQILGEKVEWRTASKACRLLVHKDVDLSNRDNWEECYKWFISKAEPLKRVSKLGK